MSSIIDEYVASFTPGGNAILAEADCKKAAEYALITFKQEPLPGGFARSYTTVEYYHSKYNKPPSPMDDVKCEYSLTLDGNPFELNLGQSKISPLVSQALLSSHAITASDAATLNSAAIESGQTISGFDILSNGKTVLSVTHTIPIAADDFLHTIILDIIGDRTFQAIVALLDDDTVVTGGHGSVGYEVGAGNDTVNAGAGDDTVYKWKSGKLAYDGGSGNDTLNFNTPDGATYPTPHAAGAVVNLSAGTGTNPYGGMLTLTSVENIIGTDKADTLTGSNADNRFGDGIYDIGADTINALGGNDRVELAEVAFGVHADGGAGIDTLAVNLGLSGPANHKLDLTNQTNNTGVFKNDVLTNFEIFEQGKGLFGATGQTFTFIDTNDGHTVSALGAISTLTLNGGDDTVKLGYWRPKVTADGGAGKDTLNIGTGLLGGANTLDLTDQSKNSGIFAGSKFTNFEAFTGVDATGGFTGASFVFRGTGLAESITGSALADNLNPAGGNDIIDGGRGNDTLTGGKGKDHFLFNSLLNPLVPLNNVDAITDFSSKDTIDLDNAVFAALTKTGVLKGKFFHIGSKAADKDDYVLYNNKTGVLSYDADGKKHGAAPVAFAQIDDHLKLTHADFLVI